MGENFFFVFSVLPFAAATFAADIKADFEQALAVS